MSSSTPPFPSRTSARRSISRRSATSAPSGSSAAPRARLWPCPTPGAPSRARSRRSSAGSRVRGSPTSRSRLTVNLLGGPAMTPGEFAARTPETTLGFTLVTVAPTGQYFPDKLINLGSESVGLQDGVRILSAGRKVGVRGLCRRLVLHAERRLLRWPASNAGTHLCVPGPRQLHLSAAPVARRERDVLHRRRDEPRWCAPPGPAEELSGEPDRLRAGGAKKLHQALEGATRSLGRISRPTACRTRFSGSTGVTGCRLLAALRMSFATTRSIRSDGSHRGRRVVDVEILGGQGQR